MQSFPSHQPRQYSIKYTNTTSRVFHHTSRQSSIKHTNRTCRVFHHTSRQSSNKHTNTTSRVFHHTSRQYSIREQKFKSQNIKKFPIWSMSRTKEMLWKISPKVTFISYTWYSCNTWSKMVIRKHRNVREDERDAAHAGQVHTAHVSGILSHCKQAITILPITFNM